MSSKQATRAFREWLIGIKKEQDAVYQARKEFLDLIALAQKEKNAAKKAKLLQQANSLTFPKDFRIRFWKDWHKLADVEDIDEFVKITSGLNWGPKRRGEAFERWLQIRKTKETHLPKVKFSINDDFLKELEIDLQGYKWREPDRFKIRSKSVWDHKHFYPETPVKVDQLNVYLDLANVDAGIDRVCYMFSTQQSAKDNLKRIEQALQANPLKAGKSVQLFYIDNATNKIRRFKKLP